MKIPVGRMFAALLLALQACSTLAGGAPRTPRPGVLPPISVSNLDRLVQQGKWGKGSILRAQFSPNGQQLGVVTALGLYVYDAETLQQLRFFPGGGLVTTGAFSPDWSLLATASGETVTLRSFQDGRLIEYLRSGKGDVSRLLFSPNGNLLASVVSPPGEEVYSEIVDLWSVPEHRLLSSWDISVYDDVTFAPDGKSFLAWNRSEPRPDGVRQWQIPSGTLLPTETNWHPYPAAFSPDGSFYAAEAYDKILIERLADRHEMGEFSAGRSQFFISVLFSSDSSIVVALTNGGTIHVWSLITAALLSSFELEPGADRVLAISPDAKILAVHTASGLALYNLANGLPVRRLGDHPSNLDQGVIAPRADRLAARVGDRALAVWSIPDARLLYVIPQTDAYSIAWSPDENWLVWGGADHSVHVLRASDGSEIRAIASNTGSIAQILSLGFSQDGKLLASSTSYSIKLWNFENGTLVRDIGVPGGFVSDVRFSPDGTYLTALRGDQVIGVWRAMDGQEQGQLAAPPVLFPNAIDFASDSSLLAVGSPAEVQLWDFKARRPPKILQAGSGVVTALRISPDGSLLVSGSSDGTIELWHLPTGRLLRVLKAGLGRIGNLGFSADGRRLLAVSSAGMVWLWGVTE